MPECGVRESAAAILSVAHTAIREKVRGRGTRSLRRLFRVFRQVKKQCGGENEASVCDDLILKLVFVTIAFIFSSVAAFGCCTVFRKLLPPR